MKIFFFIITLIINSSISLANDNIYFVDVDFILNNSIFGKKTVDKLKKINATNVAEIENDELELKKFEDEINKIKNIITEDELKKKIAELKDKILIFKNKKDIKFNEFNDLKNKELKEFFSRITPIIEEFMEINSIIIILEKKNIFIANSKYDKTEELINFLNKKINHD